MLNYGPWQKVEVHTWQHLELMFEIQLCMNNLLHSPLLQFPSLAL
jgi:hypothetical protein